MGVSDRLDNKETNPQNIQKNKPCTTRLYHVQKEERKD